VAQLASIYDAPGERAKLRIHDEGGELLVGFLAGSIPRSTKTPGGP
jgi:hypothetical protein